MLSFAFSEFFVYLNCFFYPHNKHLAILLSGMEDKATEVTAKILLQEIKFLFLVEN
jgi:hypothetical protein